MPPLGKTLENGPGRRPTHGDSLESTTMFLVSLKQRDGSRRVWKSGVLSTPIILPTTKKRIAK